MAQLFKFFNSAPGDPRTYQAADFAEYFGTVLQSGIISVDGQMGLQVTHDIGLTVNISEGGSILRGHLYKNTAQEQLELALPEVTLDRIDRIVLRLDSSAGARNILLAVKQGESSGNPAPPTLTRNSFIYEISLAQIFLERNTASVGTITDERLNEDLAGAVSSLISVPTNVFEEEFADVLKETQDEFEEWFDGIKLDIPVSREEFLETIKLDNPETNSLTLTPTEQIKSTEESYVGVTEFEVSGMTLNQLIEDGENQPDGMSRTFQSVDGDKYFVKPTNDFATGTGDEITVTNNTGGDANIMAIPLTGTPYENMTAEEINARIGTYWEGLKSTEETEVASRGRNLFDGELEAGTLDADGVDAPSIEMERTINFILVKPNTTYTVSNEEGRRVWLFGYDKNKERIYTNSNATTFTTPDGTRFLRFRLGLDNKQIMLNEGSTAPPYEPYKGSKTKITCTDKEKFDLAETLDAKNEIIFKQGKYTAIKRLALVEGEYQAITPITIDEKDFSSYGIEVDGLLTSNTGFTEFYIDNFDLAPTVNLDYPTNIARGTESNTEATRGNRHAISNAEDQLNGRSVRIGADAKTVGTNTVVIGRESENGGPNRDVIVGAFSKTEPTGRFGNILIGSEGKIGTEGEIGEEDAGGSIVLGYQAKSLKGRHNIVFGRESEARENKGGDSTSGNMVVAGFRAFSEGTRGIALGSGAKVFEADGIAIGRTAESIGENGIAIGRDATADENEIVLGSTGHVLKVGDEQVFERGSNDNGEYVKLLDGTMICWIKSLTIDERITERVLGKRWTYPAEFISAFPHVSIDIRASAGSWTDSSFMDRVSFAGTLARGATSADLRIRFSPDSTLPEPFEITNNGILAIGRWK